MLRSGNFEGKILVLHLICKTWIKFGLFTSRKDISGDILQKVTL